MAEAQEKDRAERERQEPEDERERRREAIERGASGSAEDDDPREEEGWSQPESSAQKGALPDEG